MPDHDQAAEQAPADTTPETTEAEQDQAPEPDEQPERAKTGNREAKYRTERNEARAERDAMAARIDTYERRQLDRLAADKLADPADWQPDRDALRDEDGNLDEDKAAAALDELLAAKPHYAKPKVPTRSSGPIAGGNGSPPPPPRMGSIFRG
ncbi:hypothetical protein GCM10009854_27890 [Saccharopolyspora halophila]|uniref:Scaffolding protein n=1 Tax=Saccharopolyspora halophila TaxID=405551 RepID=A0ABN3GEV1_9PSEU